MAYTPEQQEAVNAYLAGGGDQASVDRYFAGNPTQEQFLSDARQYWNVPNPQDTIAPVAPQAPAAPILPPGWQDMYNKQSPQVQAAIRERYGNMSPDQIMQDWQQNIVPNYAPGTAPEDIMSGAATATGAIPKGGVQAPQDYYTQLYDDPGRIGARKRIEQELTAAGYDPWGMGWGNVLSDPEFTWDNATATSPGGPTGDWTTQQQQQQSEIDNLLGWFQEMVQGQRQNQGSYYQPGFAPGSANDPRIVQNAIANQTDPNSVAGLFKNLTTNFNALQQQQGGSAPIMSALDQGPVTAPKWHNPFAAPPPPPNPQFAAQQAPPAPQAPGATTAPKPKSPYHIAEGEVGF